MPARQDLRRGGAAVVTLLIGAPALAADVAADALEGRWLGTAGVPGREQIVVGLEFRRDDRGVLKLFLTEPILNMFGAPNTGKLERDGDRVVVPDFAMTLTRNGDRLEGTYFGWTWGTPLVTADRIYAGVAGGKPYFIDHVASFTVLDRKTGAIVERWPLPEALGAFQWGIGGSLARDGDTIIATTLDGAVYGFPIRS